MALTVEQAIKEIRHEIGGATHSRLPELEIVNRAGQWLFGARKWRFLQRTPIKLSTIAGQGHIELPAEVGSIDKMIVTGSSAMPCHPASSATVLETRQNGWLGIFLYAVSWQDAVEEHGETRPVLLIAPIPTVSEVDFFTALYTADWVDIRDPSAQGNLTGNRGRFPTYMEPLYIEALRALAAGYERRSGGSPTERFTAIEKGAIWDGAVRRDTRQQRSYGTTIKPAASLQPDWYSGNALPPQ